MNCKIAAKTSVKAAQTANQPKKAAKLSEKITEKSAETAEISAENLAQNPAQNQPHSTTKPPPAQPSAAIKSSAKSRAKSAKSALKFSAATILAVILATILAITLAAVIVIARFDADAFRASFEGRYSHVLRARGGEILTLALNPSEQWHLRERGISPRLKTAAVAFEDGRFYAHAGVDFLALARAAAGNLLGAKKSGASTITMQLVKLRHAQPRTLTNKITETFEALAVDFWLEKDEILELYLNNAPYGKNIVGAGAAALFYLGRETGASSGAAGDLGGAAASLANSNLAHFWDNSQIRPSAEKLSNSNLAGGGADFANGGAGADVVLNSNLNKKTAQTLAQNGAKTAKTNAQNGAQNLAKNDTKTNAQNGENNAATRASQNRQNAAARAATQLSAPNDISWAQAATLAVLPNAPALISGAKNRERLRAKRDFLLRKLHARGELDGTALEFALAEPLPVFAPRTNAAPHLAHALFSPTRREITSTIDARIQRDFERIVAEFGEKIHALGIDNAAALLLDTRTGEARAYVGSQGFLSARGGQVNGVRAPRSVGSTLKPFLFALALDDGLISPRSWLADAPTHFANFAPQNANRRFRGLVRADDALRASLNVPFVWLLARYGYERFFYRVADWTGEGGEPARWGLSFILGTREMSLESLAGLYLALARGGELAEIVYERGASAGGDFGAVSAGTGAANSNLAGGFGASGGDFGGWAEDLGEGFAFEVGDFWGANFTFVAPMLANSNLTGLADSRANQSKKTSANSTFAQSPASPARRGKRAFSAGSAWLTLEALSGVKKPAGFEHFAPRVAWKTGTSYGRKDAWAVGATPRYTLGVWVGNFGGEANANLLGASVAGELFFTLLGALDLGDEWFARPAGLRAAWVDESGYNYDFCADFARLAARRGGAGAGASVAAGAAGAGAKNMANSNLAETGANGLLRAASSARNDGRGADLDLTGTNADFAASAAGGFSGKNSARNSSNSNLADGTSGANADFVASVTNAAGAQNMAGGVVADVAGARKTSANGATNANVNGATKTSANGATNANVNGATKTSANGGAGDFAVCQTRAQTWLPARAKRLIDTPFFKRVFVAGGREVSSLDGGFAHATPRIVPDFPPNVAAFLADSQRRAAGQAVKIIYPTRDLRLVVTRDFGGENEFVFAVANPAGRELFWYLDDELVYAGRAARRALRVERGAHTLFVVTGADFANGAGGADFANGASGGENASGGGNVVGGADFAGVGADLGGAAQSDMVRFFVE